MRTIISDGKGLQMPGRFTTKLAAAPVETALAEIMKTMRLFDLFKGVTLATNGSGAFTANVGLQNASLSTSEFFRFLYSFNARITTTAVQASGSITGTGFGDPKISGKASDVVTDARNRFEAQKSAFNAQVQYVEKKAARAEQLLAELFKQAKTGDNESVENTFRALIELLDWNNTIDVPALIAVMQEMMNVLNLLAITSGDGRVADMVSSYSGDLADAIAGLHIHTRFGWEEGKSFKLPNSDRKAPDFSGSIKVETIVKYLVSQAQEKKARVSKKAKVDETDPVTALLEAVNGDGSQN